MEKKITIATEASELSVDKLVEEYNAQVTPNASHAYVVSVYDDYSDSADCC